MIIIRLLAEKNYDILCSINLNLLECIKMYYEEITLDHTALMYPGRIKGLILYCSGYLELKKPEKKITYEGPPETMCNDYTKYDMRE